jgi:hypothetical protein
MNRMNIVGHLHSALSQANVEISEKASEILVTCILAIKEDPEPSWPKHAIVDDPDDAFERNAINGLTLKLAELSNPQRTRPRRLHTYTILHHISDWVDQLCPFEKPEKNHRRR